MLHYTNPEASVVAFPQSYSFKAGLKKFGKVGKTAAVTELTQLHTYKTYHPVHAKSLSPAEQKQALSSLMNIVEKRNGRVRAQAVADGSKERTQPGYKKEDGASPTVATNSIMITAAIDAHKQRDVATIDIPGAFLHAYNDKETLMLLKGRLAKLMVQVDPQLYRKFVIYDKNNQALLYVKLSKAIYGLLKSALLFYRKFVEDLKMPFTINPYDPCVANATINGKQMTITWHINNLIVSHVDPFPNNEICCLSCYHLWQRPHSTSRKIPQLPWHGSQFCYGRNCASVNDHIHIKNTHQLSRARHYILRNPSSGSPLHHMQGKQGQIPARSASPSLPSHSHPTPVPLQMNLKRYPDGCLLPHNTLQTPRQRQLG